MIYFPHLAGRRILLVSHLLSQTGAPMLLVETAHALAKSGASVTLTNLTYTEPIFRLQTILDLRIVPVDQSFIEAGEADLIIANTAETSEWVKTLLTIHPRAGPKLIWWIHEMGVDYYRRRMSSLAGAGAAIFDSRASSRLWRLSGIRMPATVRVIHAGLSGDFLRAAAQMTSHRECGAGPEQEPGRFPSRETTRARLRVNREDFLISLFGSYCHRKGQNLLLKTVGRMLEADPGLGLKLLLVGFRGKTRRREFLHGLSSAESLALSKHCALRAVSDVKPYFSASDAFVMNTQDPGEAFGRVTIEAMAFRLPVLGSDCGGTPEIVIDGVTGLLHPAGKSGQTILAKNIWHLVKNRKQAAALGEAGFQRVTRHFTEERFYHELAELFDLVTQNLRLE